MKEEWTENEEEIWEKIKNFELDDPNSIFPFSKRLSFENNWNESKTFALILEYKKFIFLCTVANPCSPSKEVDQVWHLHLLYCKNYWEDLCENIVKRRLNHNPSSGVFLFN